jgi:hypothetical protein
LASEVGMWNMHSGKRVLTDSEWTVFQHGLGVLRDLLEEDLESPSDLPGTGVLVFDRLTTEQKFVLLADVASALRDPVVPIPELTAVNEGAVAAVINILRDLLQGELDANDSEAKPPRTELRRALLAVGAEHGWEEMPAATDADSESWAFVLDSFEDLILWDADYELADQFLDLPPDAAREIKELSGIPENFYIASPIEPDARRLEAARVALRRMCGMADPT